MPFSPDRIVMVHGLRYVVRRAVAGGYSVPVGSYVGYTRHHPRTHSWRVIKDGVMLFAFDRKGAAIAYAKRHARKSLGISSC